jgi:hypothetical protein
MRIDRTIGCSGFPCQDVRHEGYAAPSIDISPERVKIVLISEAAPEKSGDYYYAPGRPLFMETTLQAFQDAGAAATSLRDLLEMGVYLTTAVKCAKTAYAIQKDTVKRCAAIILAGELALFPNVRAVLLMGDVAIQAMNEVARLAGGQRVIPAGATYKIRAAATPFRAKGCFLLICRPAPVSSLKKASAA